MPVTFASFEASGSFTDRGTEGMAAEDAVRAREGLHEEVEVGDAPPANVTRGWSRRCSIFSRRPVTRLSMMTTSWCCAKVSARFEPGRPRR